MPKKYRKVFPILLQHKFQVFPLSFYENKHCFPAENAMKIQIKAFAIKIFFLYFNFIVIQVLFH